MTGHKRLQDNFDLHPDSQWLIKIEKIVQLVIFVMITKLINNIVWKYSSLGTPLEEISTKT